MAYLLLFAILLFAAENLDIYQEKRTWSSWFNPSKFIHIHVQCMSQERHSP